MANSYKKTILLTTFLVAALVIISGCESMQEETAVKPNYLDLDINNSYGVKSLSPGEGRFVYEEGAIAEIDFEEAEGYDFRGWSGEDADKVEGENGKYSIQMSDNANIELDMSLKKFMPVALELDDNDEVDYPEETETVDFPYSLETLVVKFNNKVNEANELNLKITDEDGNNIENVSSSDAEIAENNIQFEWSNEVFTFKDDDGSFNHEDEYTIVIDQNGVEDIFDSAHNEIEGSIKINFTLKAPVPETPQQVVFKEEENKISWLRSNTNSKIDDEDYVEEYNIYRYADESDFDPGNPGEPYDEITGVSENQKIINKEIEADYFYRIEAINRYDKASRLSEPVSTD